MNFILIIQAEEHKDKRIREICSFVLMSKIFKISSYDKFLIEKEFKQLFRNSFLPKLIFIFPCMIMILMPWAANLEIKNINLNIVDNDHSVLSRRLVDKIGVFTYFRLTALSDTYDEALLAIEAGSADVVLEIPRDFEKVG